MWQASNFKLNALLQATILKFKSVNEVLNFFQRHRMKPIKICNMLAQLSMNGVTSRQKKVENKFS